MALPATADFTGSNSTQVRTLTNWDGCGDSNGSHGFTINSNQAAADASAATGADWWTGDTFDNDQYSQATITNNQNSTYQGVAVRCSGTDNGSNLTAYIFYSAPNDGCYIDKYVNGSFVSTLAGPGTAFAVNDVVRLEVSGNALTGKVGGVTRLSVTDSSSPIASGAAGIGCNSGSVNARLDNWEGGNLSVATKAPPPRRQVLRVWSRRR